MDSNVYPATHRQLRSRLRENVPNHVLGRWLNRASRLGKPGIVRLILDKLRGLRIGEFWTSARSALGAMLRPRPVPIWKEPRAIQDRYFETVKILVDAGALMFFPSATHEALADEGGSSWADAPELTGRVPARVSQVADARPPIRPSRDAVGQPCRAAIWTTIPTPPRYGSGGTMRRLVGGSIKAAPVSRRLHQWLRSWSTAID